MANRVLALAGGVGGAKLALGLARVLSPEALTIIVNTGDDDEPHGLPVSPDLDTVTYTLAGLANPEMGWGLAGDSRRVLDALGRLGSDTWFWLGDLDIATHIRRAELLRAGRMLSEATAEISSRLGVKHTIAPMTDDRVRTVVDTDEGVLPFQDYFVRRRCEPRVNRLIFDGAEGAKPSPVFDEALDNAAAVVFCPSNPFLSIGPILAVPTVRDCLVSRPGRPLAVVSPIIGGQAVKGPAARLFEELLGEAPSALGVARHYRGQVSHFVLDNEDAALSHEVESLGYSVLVTQTLMKTEEDKIALARAVCDFVGVETA